MEYIIIGGIALAVFIFLLVIIKVEALRNKANALFQVSDMLTFVDKIVYKHNNNIPLTKSEKYFFSVKDILGIIRQLKNKRL